MRLPLTSKRGKKVQEMDEVGPGFFSCSKDKEAAERAKDPSRSFPRPVADQKFAQTGNWAQKVKSSFLF
jgi:hypothetical protein